MGKNFRETLEEQLNDPEFKKEYDALEPEFTIIKALLNAREASGLRSAEKFHSVGYDFCNIPFFAVLFIGTVLNVAFNSALAAFLKITRAVFRLLSPHDDVEKVRLSGSVRRFVRSVHSQRKSADGHSLSGRAKLGVSRKSSYKKAFVHNYSPITS